MKSFRNTVSDFKNLELTYDQYLLLKSSISFKSINDIEVVCYHLHKPKSPFFAIASELFPIMSEFGLLLPKPSKKLTFAAECILDMFSDRIFSILIRAKVEEYERKRTEETSSIMFSMNIF